MQLQNIQRFELSGDEVKNALIAFINQYETLPAGAEYEFSVRSGAVLSATITVNAPMQKREAPNANGDLPYINYALGARVQYGVDKFGYVIEQLDNNCYTLQNDIDEQFVAHASALELAPKVDEYIPPPPAPARKPRSSRLENDEAGPFDNKAPQFPQGSRVRVLIPCEPDADVQGYDLATVTSNNSDDSSMIVVYDDKDKQYDVIFAPYHGQVEQASDGE